MDTNVYALLMPLLLALIIAEFIYCLHRRNGYYNFQDSIANLGTAIGNQIVNVGVAAVIFSGYAWIYRRSPWRIEPDPLALSLLFLGIDFLFYWFHRAGHTINILWAAHSPHHSSEELNYTVAARASVTQRAASFVFYAPLAAAGYAPEILLPAVLVHHTLQFWPHTRAIERLPAWFEAVFNAPTHHRVHHGINDRYLDKNFGGVLILWDKLFGTFEPETDPVIYGVRPALGTWDPIEINFHYYKVLWRQSAATPRWKDKLLLWVMPLGWTPPGTLVPGGIPSDPNAQVKYQTVISAGAQVFLAASLAPAIGLMMLVTEHDSPLDSSQKALAGVLIWGLVLLWGVVLEGRAFKAASLTLLSSRR